MIRSMTGFVSRSLSLPAGEVSIELRTINHRYLDINLRLPEVLRAQEMVTRELIQARLKRGRVDLTIRCNQSEHVADEILINEDVLAALASNKKRVATHFPDSSVNFFDILRWPKVMQKPDANIDQLVEPIQAALPEVLTELITQREREGAKVKTFILDSLSSMREYHLSMQQCWPTVRANSRTRLSSRLEELQASVDPNRFEQEVVFLLQKQDIAEELQRLLVHIEETEKVVTTGGVVGRRLDFLMQELNREANTIASKSVDSDLTKAALEVKVLIEQIREQVQNIE
jgi:uncharacterized protein (TIGR00255 family)